MTRESLNQIEGELAKPRSWRDLPVRLRDLADRLGVELRGDGDVEVSGVSSLDEVRAGEVTYVATAPRVAEAAAAPAAALIVPRKLAADPALVNHQLLIASDAKLAFARLIAFFHEPPYQARGVSPDLISGAGSVIGEECSIHPRVTSGTDCRMGHRVTLHPGVVIGDRVEIGAGTEILPNVTIYDGTVIGARCRIHSGTVIGADGFSDNAVGAVALARRVLGRTV